jgi:hypothetical protein
MKLQREWEKEGKQERKRERERKGGTSRGQMKSTTENLLLDALLYRLVAEARGGSIFISHRLEPFVAGLACARVFRLWLLHMLRRQRCGLACHNIASRLHVLALARH